MVLQFFLPGVPSIYYGDEAGLQGWKDPFNRRCYPWGHEDQDLLQYTKTLCHLRADQPVFARGKMEFLLMQQDVLGFSRWDPETGDSVLILLNRSNTEQAVSLEDPAFAAYTVQKQLYGEQTTAIPAYGFLAFRAVRHA